MTLVKVNRPRVPHTFDSIFRNFWDDSTWNMPTVWRPAMDAVDQEKSYEISFSLPGFERKDIQVSLKDGMLTVSAEHAAKKEEEEQNYLYREISRGTFKRSLELPDNIDTDKIDAQYKSGILTLSIPKTEAALPREIEVKVK